MRQNAPAVGPWAVLVFVCELAMLAGLAVAGFRLVPPGPMAYALMVALPIAVAVAVVWGSLLAPRSTRGLKGRAAAGGKCIVFVVAGLLLAVTGLWPWGLALVVVAVLALLMADREAAGRRR